MITIAEPQEYIASLWGKQQIVEMGTYRLMKYVIRLNYDSKVLLHNVVTGQLVVLEQGEAGAVESLPMAYTSTIEQLVSTHFLVAENYDEHAEVIKLREILRALDERQKPRDIITHYTILPTTSCNARCYYCFEKGCASVTMTEKTADDVVKFITAHCGNNKKIQLSWFGGEPTIAAHRINQICYGLQAQRISYRSDITTNGYLLNEEMIEKAVNLWNLESCMICVDGTENTYNKVKAYVAANDNPYEQVMSNIKSLLNHKVRVNLRMNFDLANYAEFANLVVEASSRYGKSPFLQVHAHPIFGNHKDPDGKVVHATTEWFTEKIVELNDLARAASLLGESTGLPSLEFKACQASSKSSIVIGPTGLLFRCPERFEEDEQVGNIFDEITEATAYESWMHYAVLKMCEKCILFPICQRNERCMARDTCCYFAENIKKFQSAMIKKFDHFYLSGGV